MPCLSMHSKMYALISITDKNTAFCLPIDSFHAVILRRGDLPSAALGYKTPSGWG